MGRRRKGPWQRSQDGCWYTTVGRKLHKLGTADQPYSEIEKAYHALLASAERPAAVTVAWLVESFLGDVERTRKASTRDWYARHLARCVAYFGKRLRPENLNGDMVNRWLDEDYQGASDSSRHAAARTIVRVMNWAVAQRLIDRSPLLGYTKPTPSSRETYVTPEQYAECLKEARGPFRDLIAFIWETGCRPQEARIIEGDWIDGPKVVLPRELSKGGKNRRVVYLTEAAAEIAQRNAAKNRSGPIFRNSQGRPWTKDAINCAFRRLKEKTGIDGLCAYALRHGFATEQLKRGTDTTTVGVLMGHANPNMVAKVYQHLAQDDDYLLSVLGTPPVARE